MSKDTESSSATNLNLPQEYLKNVRSEAKDSYGFSGPSSQEKKEMMEAIGYIQNVQKGHEDELTKIGVELIKKHYGDIIEGVKLDVKIVSMEDEEKNEMVNKTKENEEEEEEEDDEEYGPEVPQEEIDKRKIINNILQGEAQNIHSMMYDARDQVNEINPHLLDTYMRFLKLNKKFDWDEKIDLEQMIENAPQSANAMETDYEEDEEEGDMRPVIRARVVDLPMVIHECVKGIYELMSNGAIPEDPVLAKKIQQETDTLKNEQEDIKYGPFVAREVRNFVNKVVDDKNVTNIPNIREFVFGKMVELEANEFVDLISGIVQNDESKEKKIQELIEQIQEEWKQYQNEEVDYGMEMDEEETQEQKEEKDLSQMSTSELENYVNSAIENEDYELLRKIQMYLNERTIK